MLISQVYNVHRIDEEEKSYFSTPFTLALDLLLLVEGVQTPLSGNLPWGPYG